MTQNKLDEAIVALRKANDLDPSKAQVWEPLTWALTKQGKRDEVIAVWLKATKLNPSNAKAWTGLGRIYEDPATMADSLNARAKAVEFDSSNPGAWYELAWTQSKLEKYEEAIKKFSKNDLSRSR